MPREIIGSVRHKGKLYKKGDEEALANSGVDLARLEDKGVIAGFGGSKSRTTKPGPDEPFTETQEGAETEAEKVAAPKKRTPSKKGK